MLRNSAFLTLGQLEMAAHIPVVDIFAGPGGLGEGFASFQQPGKPRFDLRLSIEKDQWAVETLRLRAFRRQFGAALPKHLRRLILEGVTPSRIHALMDLHPREAAVARDEVWQQTLGLEAVKGVRLRVAELLLDSDRWVLIGGPPCQAYSLAGRSRNRGIASYVPEADHRQTLYIEYLQIIADHGPPVFVMENVKGLLSATLANQRMFERIIEDLTNPAATLRKVDRTAWKGRRWRYRVVPVVCRSNFALFGTDTSVSPSDFVVRSERFGVPQSRHRVILLGIRDDVPGTPGALQETLPPTVEDVIGDLPRLRSGLSTDDSSESWRRTLRSVTTAPWLEQCEDSRVQQRIRSIARAPRVPEAGRGAEALEHDAEPSKMALRWGGTIDGVVANHSARSHMSADIERYLFASAWAACRKKSPELACFPLALLPEHRNVELALQGSHFADRFRVQLRGQPATTITSHISKDGHYYIHYDPAQCRSLTVREAARLQTFPDDYVFVGPRTAQYQQVGNAVPPVLARQIAAIVADLF